MRFGLADLRKPPGRPHTSRANDPKFIAAVQASADAGETVKDFVRRKRSSFALVCEVRDALGIAKRPGTTTPSGERCKTCWLLLPHDKIPGRCV